MINDEMRGKFEVLARNQNKLAPDYKFEFFNDGDYKIPSVQRLWDFWQAAIATQAQVDDQAKNAERYLWYRNKSLRPSRFGSTSPYVMQGQTHKLLDGEELDRITDADIAASKARE